MPLKPPTENVANRKPIHRQPSSGRGIMRISKAAADAIDDPSTIEDWDDDELRRGRRKDKNGRFTGRDPVVVPTNCYRELLRRQLRTAEVSLASNLNEAAVALAAIIKSPMAEDKDKINAAKILIDRVMGKAPERLQVSTDTPLFQVVLAGGIVPGAALEEDDIIDVESEELVWE